MAAPSQSTVRPAGWQTREALQRDSAAAPGRDVVLVGHELPAVVGHLAVLAHLLEPLVAQVLWERVEGRGVGVCDGPRAITRAVPSAGSGGGTLAGVGGKSKWRATGFARARAAVCGVGRNPPPAWRWPSSLLAPPFPALGTALASGGATAPAAQAAGRPCPRAGSALDVRSSTPCWRSLQAA